MITTITPDKAKELLENNKINRRIKQFVVQQYTDLLKKGLWKYNGQPIIVSRLGNLLDGQHRLTACVVANKAFTTEVIEGVADDVFDTIDTGSKRSFSDVLSIEKKPEHINRARITRVLYLYDNGSDLKKGVHSKILLEFYYEHEAEISYGARELQKFTKIYNVSVIGLAKIITARQSVYKSQDFFDKLLSGASLDAKDPILVLRNKLMEITRLKIDDRNQGLRLILKAWSLSLGNKRVSKLVVERR